MRPTSVNVTRRSIQRPKRERTVDHLRELSDEELMTHFQAGTLAAFDLLVERFTGPLMSYLYGFIGDRRACEDLLQETFLRVYRNRHGYRRIARFSTWVYTIAGNLARSEYRRRKRRRTYSLSQVDDEGEAFEHEIPDPAASPEEEAADSLLMEQMEAALEEMRPDFREVVVLRDIQQLSYDEIATITGLPMGTVKSRINRARTKIQQRLAAAEAVMPSFA